MRSLTSTQSDPGPARHKGIRVTIAALSVLWLVTCLLLVAPRALASSAQPASLLVTTTTLLAPASAGLALIAMLATARRTGAGLGNGWVWIATSLVTAWLKMAWAWVVIGPAPALLALVGVVLLGTRAIRPRLTDPVDGIVLALGLVAVWSTLTAAAPVPSAATPPGSVQLVAEIALFVVAVMILVRGRVTWVLQLGAATALLATSCLVAAVMGPGHATVSSAVALTATAAYLLLASSAVGHRTTPRPARADPDPLVAIASGAGRLSGLPYLPLAAALSVAIVQWSLGAAPTSTTVLLLLAAAGLTLARQYLTLRDNRHLVTAVLAGRSDLHRQARLDPVTGLGNRALFTQALADALTRRAEDGRALAVLVCDVDGFRNLNDALGGTVGDRVLAEIGTRIRDGVPAPRVVARLGGDEFAVLIDDLDECDGASRAQALAVRVQDRVAAPFSIDGVPVGMGVAVGTVVVDPLQPAVSADEVLGRADVALDVARRSARRRPVLHTDGMSLPDSRDWQLRPALGQALRSGSVAPYFQPLVELGTGRVRGFEALARWTHAGQVTGPDVFLPVAARAGLLPELATQIMRAAAEQLLVWRARPGRGRLQVAINVSPTQIVDATFPDQVRRVLDEVGLPADGLVMEITEESLLDDQDGAARVVSQLRRLGVTVWLDDFGAGYSSLALLNRLQLQAIKLDESLVRRVDVDDHLRRLVGGLVALGGDLGLEVIAEGIQRGPQAQVLLDLGCVLGQGFLFAPALTGADCEPLLRRPALHTPTSRLAM